MDEKPQRQTYAEGWELYPISMVGHHIQGLAAGTGIMEGGNWATAGCAAAGLYVAYQALTLPRKKDSAGLDVADFIVGFGVAIAVYGACQALGVA